MTSLGGVRLRDGQPVCEEHTIGSEHLRASTSAGLIDIIRGGLPPLDFATVASRAMRADYGDFSFRVAGLRSVVAFKRLGDRPRDLSIAQRLGYHSWPLPQAGELGHSVATHFTRTNFSHPLH